MNEKYTVLFIAEVLNELALEDIFEIGILDLRRVLYKKLTEKQNDAKKGD